VNPTFPYSELDGKLLIGNQENRNLEHEPDTVSDEAAQSDASESKLPSQRESSAVQPGNELPKSVHSRKQGSIAARKEAKTASAPGSDYWLG
jgi:hypothetical protein